VLVIQRALSKGVGYSPDEIAKLTLPIIVSFLLAVCSPAHTDQSALAPRSDNAIRAHRM
jgi:hypothetical protein